MLELSGSQPASLLGQVEQNTAPRERSRTFFCLRPGESPVCTEPVLSGLVPDVSIGSVFEIHVLLCCLLV